MEREQRSNKLKQTLNAEAALRNFKERNQIILEGIEEGYTEVDLSGAIVLCNDSCCRIFGYPMEELIGMSYKVYTDEVMANAVFTAYNNVYRKRVSNKGFNYEIIRKDGTRRIIENSISLIIDSKGNRVGFRSVVRDITDRIRNEEELAKHRSRLRAIFRSVKDAIITVDAEMVVVEANRAAESICGLNPEKDMGRAFPACTSQCNKNCHEVIKNALENRSTIREYQIDCGLNHQSKQRVIITISPLLNRNNKFMGSVVVIRDITKISYLERELKERHQFQKLIGKSSEMQDIYVLLNDLASLATTVLFTGESGTGKSLAAKALHYSGSRALKSLVTVNCSALSENLLESELFGHVKGAFTGAINDTRGRFQIAQGGTILLDEIGDTSPRIQLKLLRVLEEKEFERVGESVPIKVGARVIACTNRNLKEKVKQGDFREDLYYRLKVVEITLPPLRKRLGDIPLLVAHFCDVFNKNFQKKIKGVSDEVLDVFMNYRWPGNVRELGHSMEHAFVICRGPIICIDHIPAELREYPGAKKCIREKRRLEGPEKILTVLGKTDWNKAKAARILGIDRSTLYRKIHKYTLSKPVKKS